jgi:hypothetical protein
MFKKKSADIVRRLAVEDALVSDAVRLHLPYASGSPFLAGQPQAD